jgi:hypothetical protein
MVKKKHQPPAKIKYDKSHPTVSVRVDQELKNKLDEIKEISGKSVGDILREAVEVQMRSTKKARTLGFTQGRLTYGVEYKCAVCGGTIWIDTSEEKKAAAQYMREHGWRHGDCLQKSG